MAVLKVKRRFQDEYTETEDSGEVRSATVWMVQFDTDTSSVATQGATDGTNTVPTYLTPHPDEPGLRAVRIRATPMSENTRRIYKVVCEHSSFFNLNLNNPLGVTTVAWDFEEAGQEPYFFDYNPQGKSTLNGQTGNYVINTAGDRFQDYLQRVTGSITATYSQQIAPTDFDPSTDGFPNLQCINSIPFTIPASTAGGTAVTLAAYQARCSGISCDGTVNVLNGVKFVTLKAVFKIKKSWLDVIDSRGFNEKDPANSGQLRPIVKNVPNTQYPGGWPLDTNGKACPTLTTQPASLTFYPYQLVDFTPLVAPYTS